MKTVLVCDDDQSILQVIKMILEKRGYDVIVDNGKTIYEKINLKKPDLVLLDILLAGINGGDIAKKLKSQDKTKNIPIIMVTASYDIEKIAQEAKADGILKKPFDILDLESIVGKYLEA